MYEHTHAHSAFLVLCSAYVECVDGGMFEWDTVQDELVHFFPNVSGYLTAALGDDWIIAADSANNIATLLLPQGATCLLVVGVF